MKPAQEDLKARIAELERENAGLRIEQRTAAFSAEREDRERQWRAFDAVLSCASDLFFVVDLEGRFLYANHAVLKLWGRKLDEVLGKTRLELGYPSAVAARIEEQIQEVIKTGRRIRDHLPYAGASGETRQYELIWAPTFDSSGKVEAVAGTGRDITEAGRLRDEVLMFRYLADQSPDFVGIANPQFQGIYINEAGRKLFGVGSMEAVREVRILDFFQPKDHAFVQDTIFPCLAREGHWAGEIDFRHLQTGESIPMFYNAYAIRDSAGKVLWLATVSRDLREEKRGREALRTSEERLAFALEAAGGVGTWDWDVKSDRVYSTEQFAKLFSVDPARAWAGAPLADFVEAIHTEDRELVRSKIDRGLALGGPFAADYRVVQEDGSERWIHALGRAYHDAEGRPSRFPGVVIDITERKATERALQRSEEFNRRVLESTRDCVKVLDLDARILSINRNGQKELGIEDLGSFLHKSWLDFWQDPADRAAAEAALAQARNGAEGQFEGYSPTLNGVPHWWDVRITPMNDANGRPETLLAISRNITERKRGEEQERERLGQLRETARLESLGVLAGGIAHDFNNLLTGILGNASLLAETVDEDDRPLTDQIVLAAERAADLTGQMLAYSGKGRFVIEVLDLNTLVRENLTLLRATLSRAISVEVKLADETCLIEADAAQIQQVVMNLLINASEAIGERPGQVAIRTALTERPASRFSDRLQSLVPAGLYALLEVRDDGSGMPPETLKKIFDPFFTTKFTGRGLGLAAVLGIVKGHQGDIEVESEPGAGTTFRVLLPASTHAITRRRKQRPAAAVRARDRTVLVVDDEEIVWRTASRALESWGYRVVVATNGLEAVEVLRSNPGISLVILDLTMPVMTGEQAIPLIQALRPEIPIILSSGFSEADILRRFASFGIAGVLQKPYTMAGILSKVSESLRSAGE